jgi:protein SCO1/2
LLGATAAIVAIAIAGALRGGPGELHGVPADGRPTAPDFRLGDQHGEPFRLRDARGNVVLLVFGYTRCKDACPLTLATWARARAELADDARQVRFVFISVDPVRDTPEEIGRFVAQFDPKFIGVTGPAAAVEDVVVGYGAYARAEAAHDGAIAHSEATFLIDRQGRLVEALPIGTSAADIVADVRLELGR